MEYHIAYITAKNKSQAKTIGKALVSKRLAACANIIDRVQSLYWWQGKLQDDTEAILIVKTRKTLVKKLIALVKKLHTYSCPCIVTFPIQNGNQSFLDWIRAETRSI